MSNVTCPSASLLQPIVDTLRYAIYQIAAPCCFVIDLAGHCLLFFFLYKQSKTQSLYVYQVFRAISEMVHALTGVAYALSIFSFFSADPAYRNPMPALNNNYALVWYAAHLATPLLSSVYTTSILLSTSMVADRVFALYKPMAYGLINQKRRQVAVVVLSVSLGFGPSVFDCFRNRVVDGTTPNSFTAVKDTEYLQSTTALISALCRVLLQAVSLSVLVTLSVCLIFLYRSRFVKAGVQMSDQNVEQRKRSERTLTLLTLLACFFDVVGMSLIMAFFVFAYGFPSIYACYGKLMTPLLDLTTGIIKMCDFYTIFIVSKQFRKKLRESLPCGKMSKNTINVAPAQRL